MKRKSKSERTLSLSKLETRFILNLVLDEHNKMHPYFQGQPGHEKLVSQTNINDVSNYREYEKKLHALQKKLGQFDIEWYETGVRF
jgi:hypothetical protein